MSTDRQPVPGGSERASRIVVGVDGSLDGRAALRWAAGHAGLTGQELRLVTAVGPNHQFIDDREAHSLMEHVIAEASREAHRMVPGAIVSHAEHLRAPRRALLEESRDADLLVVGSRGRGGFAGLALGSVSRGCAHECRCPVVVVRASDAEVSSRAVEPGNRRIVVGADGSPSSGAALLWAARQADLTGATLEVLTSWDWVEDYGWGIVVPSEFDPGAESDQALRRALEPVSAAFPGITLDTAVVEGPAAQVLVKASTGADLIAVGSRGHSEARNLLLGSVSEYCATHAHCPVLIMHDASA